MEGENENLPMAGKPIKTRDLKSVPGLLEWTPNVLRLSDDTTPKLRVVFNQSQPFKNQVLSKVSSKEAMKTIYKQVGIETASAHQQMAEQTQVKPLTVDTSTGSIEKMELSSPMTKMRKVTTSQEAEPSMSRESSQVEQVIDLTDIGNSSDEEMVLEATVAHPVKVKSEPLEDDDVFTGLVDCDDHHIFLIRWHLPHHLLPLVGIDTSAECLSRGLSNMFLPVLSKVIYLGCILRGIWDSDVAQLLSGCIFHRG